MKFMKPGETFRGLTDCDCQGSGEGIPKEICLENVSGANASHIRSQGLS